MNPQIGLRIEANIGPEWIENGALVNVRSLEEDGKSRFFKSVAVPVSGQANVHSTVDVSPGVYEVSALLPSGTVLSRVVSVSANNGLFDGTLKVPAANKDWAAYSLPLGESSLADSPPSLTPVSSQSTSAYATRMFAVLATNGQSPDPLWSLLARSLSQLESDAPIDSDQLILPSANEILMSSRRASEGHVVAPIGMSPPPGHRVYLAVKKGAESILSVMPWPWSQSDGRGVAHVQAVIADMSDASQSDFSGPGWSIRPSVQDRVIAGLLEYFVSGEQRTARTLIEPARELLYYKNKNPLAAAAGAYILVGQWIKESSSPTSLDWMNWVGTLSEKFPWLPDGAILHGWLALRQRGPASMLSLARESLLKAERRGIPYFVPGVRRLVDGLMLLSGESQRRNSPDPEVEAALARVRKLAWQIDPNQPFTTVRLWSL